MTPTQALQAIALGNTDPDEMVRIAKEALEQPALQVPSGAHAALQKIIEMNRYYCRDKYGDPDRAESMACVQVARAALAEAAAPAAPDAVPQPAGEYPTINEADFDDNSKLWNLIADWRVVSDGRSTFITSQAVDHHIQALIRAYVDADRAARTAAPQMEGGGESTRDEREAFRTWAMKRYPLTTYVDSPERFSNGRTDAAWDAWQARAALAAQPAAAQGDAGEPDWLQRLRQEQSELQDRNEKLEAFIARPAFRMLDEDSRNLLERQFNQQHVLLQTLNQRLNGGIERHLRSQNHD